jgi:hypothetical protein
LIVCVGIVGVGESGTVGVVGGGGDGGAGAGVGVDVGCVVGCVFVLVARTSSWRRSMKGRERDLGGEARRRGLVERKKEDGSLFLDRGFDQRMAQRRDSLHLGRRH